MKLSNSSINTYFECGYKYYLHYIAHLRSLSVSSPLIFGSAMDKAFSRILLEKKKELTEEEKEMMQYTAEFTFLKEFRQVDIHGEKVTIAMSDRVDYNVKDIDLGLLTEEDYADIKLNAIDCNKFHSKEAIECFLLQCGELRKAKVDLDKSSKIMFNYIAYLCCIRRAVLMLEAFRRDIMPQILEVHSMQKEVNLPNGNGDYISGFIDYEATFVDGVRRVMDNKTASAPYDKNSVEVSQQLAIYSEDMQNRNCGYSVIMKEVKKKDPKIQTQLIFGTISENLLEETFTKVGVVETAVKNGIFPKNEKSCFNWGRKCDFFYKCRNNSDVGLKKIK